MEEGIVPNYPSVYISYDHPKIRNSISDQITRAEVQLSHYNSVKEILIKPSTMTSNYVDIDEFLNHVHEFTKFDIIGFTEKELGESTLDRMVRIAEIRISLSAANLHKPIHIFGSLDTVSTPLYFLAGADIFDGLTWLRYAYHDGQTVYKHNYGSKKLGINFEDFRVNGKVWNDNYSYLTSLRNDMARFLVHKNLAEFSFNADFFKVAVTQFHEKMKQKGLV